MTLDIKRREVIVFGVAQKFARFSKTLHYEIAMHDAARQNRFYEKCADHAAATIAQKTNRRIFVSAIFIANLRGFIFAQDARKM